MEYTFNGHKGLRVYNVGIYPPVENAEHRIGIINEWQDNFTPQSHMQAELVKLYHTSHDAFYLYCDVDWYWYDFDLYKMYIAPHLIKGVIGERDVDYAKSKLDKLLFELVNLPLHYSIKGKSDLIPKSYAASFYGSHDLGAMIDRDEVEFSKKWAWQQEWYRQSCQRWNAHDLSTDQIESLWLEFASKHGLISHKSPLPRRVDLVY